MSDTFQPSPDMARLLGPSVAVCVPAGPYMVSMTAFCVHAMAVVNASPANSINEMPCFWQGEDPAKARNEMAMTALGRGANWCLFIDPDMQFPPDSLARLLAHDVDIVGAAYRRRGPPYSPIAAFIDKEPAQTGLVEAEWIGLGLFLVRSTVLRAMERPWFARLYSADQMMTEDIWFCGRARKLGFKVWVDQDLTKEVLHIGALGVPWAIPNGGVAGT